jgi:hypothetical protein
MSEKIYAVMPTANSRSHSLLIRNAIKSFLSQTYENKYMIILTHGDLIDDLHEPNIQQIQVDSTAVTNKRGEIAVGLLRNIALDMLPDDTVWMVWDDDDWSHPDRMQEQYRYLIDNKLDACGMLAQIKCSLATGTAYRSELNSGLHPKFASGGHLQTMMWRTKPGYRYGSTKVSEDSILFKEYQKKFNTSGWDAPAHYFIRFQHNDNLWLGTFRDKWNRLRLARRLETPKMIPKETLYVNEILKLYKEE